MTGYSGVLFENSVDTNMQSASVAVGNGTLLPVTGYGTSVVQITGSFVGTITFEASQDGINYFSIATTQLGSGIIASTATVPGVYRSVITGMTNIRARISSYTSGSITAVGRTTNATVTSKFIQLASGTNNIGTVNASSQYPTGATIITAASGSVAATIAVATLAANAVKTTYITGFEITSAGATAAAVFVVTVTGTITGTLTYVYSSVAGVTSGNIPLIVEFPSPIPSSAVNTAIVVTLPSLGVGNTNAAVVAHGYQL